MLNKRFLRFHLPLAAYALLIFVLSSIPSLSPPDLGLDWEDKIAHFIEYSILGVLIIRSLEATSATLTAGWLWIAWGLGAFYGITDEIHQYFVPNRFASPWDATADAIGVAIGILIYRQFRIMHK